MDVLDGTAEESPKNRSGSRDQAKSRLLATTTDCSHKKGSSNFLLTAHGNGVDVLEGVTKENI